MKLHQWFILSLLTAAVLGTSSLATVLTTEEREVNEALRQLKKISAQSASAWPELESFQEKLWRAMALDPSSQQIIPLHEVPKELFSEALTTDLNQQFETIKNSEIPKNSNAQAEFDEYQKTVKTILELRIPRQFPQARAIAKRGTLDETYNQLLKKIYRAYVARNNFSHEEAFRRLENSVSAMKQSFSSERMEKTSPFSNGNQFIWAALIAIIGFIFGITAIRMNPEFFEKFTNSTAKAATHTNQLNSARWLNEFESLLFKKNFFLPLPVSLSLFKSYKH